MKRIAWAAAATTLMAGMGVCRAQPSEPEAPESQPQPAAPEDEAAEPPPTAGSAPPGYYYTEPADSPGEPRAAEQPPNAPPPAARPRGHEPPPPGIAYPVAYEPPPPPKPHHVAPKTALWAGARIGWFLPFGSLWAEPVAIDRYGYVEYGNVPWSDYASSGAAFELDVGARLGRRYNLFIAWEHAALGGGKDDPARLPPAADSDAGPESASSDYYAIGVRFSSDPDRVGFLTEFALGFRRFYAEWADGTELMMTDAPFEFRIGLGADIRLGPAFSLSPMFNLGFGSFGEAEWRFSNGDTEGVFQPADERDAHGWIGLGIGAHFDLG